METLIIISLMLLWLALTLIAGVAVESITDAVKKRNKLNSSEGTAKNHIRIFKQEKEQNIQKIA